MRKKITQILDEIIISQLLKILLLILLIYLIMGVWKWNRLPPQVPIFYSLPRGNDQLGNSNLLLIFPALTILFFGFNLFLALLLYSKEKLASQLLVIIGTIVSFLLLTSFVKIIFLVT